MSNHEKLKCQQIYQDLKRENGTILQLIFSQNGSRTFCNRDVLSIFLPIVKI